MPFSVDDFGDMLGVIVIAQLRICGVKMEGERDLTIRRGRPEVVLSDFRQLVPESRRDGVISFSNFLSLGLSFAVSSSRPACPMAAGVGRPVLVYVQEKH